MASKMEVDNKADESAVTYDYDLIVIGGGSGGIACAKEAAKLGAGVALFDFVKPTVHGTKWGLGGTCVNVGCIPKKMMHYSGLLGASFWDAAKLGWQFDDPKFSWETMIQTVTNYVRSLNFGYRVQLADKDIDYFKSYASFVDPHTVQFVHKKNVEKKTAKYIVLAMGGRPYVPNIPGRDLAITSDDIFWRKTPPGKTLCVGASYISLETAGFLQEMGYETHVAVRSILLRGFDRECAEHIGDYMQAVGVRFHMKYTVTSLEKLDSGKIKVTFKSTKSDADMTDEEKKDHKREFSDEYDTVLYATGRAPETKELNLDATGVKILPDDDGKIRTNREQTNISHIYAVGDIVYEGLELTPVAIQAGRLLSTRLFSNDDKLKKRAIMDYTNVPTTVFTPIEYSCVGYTESEAYDVYGEEDMEVFHMKNNPLETYSVHRVDHDQQEMLNTLFFKVLCVKSENNKVVGIHYIGPNAGEVMQGFALAMKVGFTKDDLDNCVGIHPTCAEWFTTLTVTKSSGETAEATAC